MSLIVLNTLFIATIEKFFIKSQWNMKTSFYEIYKLPKLTLITDNKLHAIKNKLNKKKMKDAPSILKNISYNYKEQVK